MKIVCVFLISGFQLIASFRLIPKAKYIAVYTSILE